MKIKFAGFVFVFLLVAVAGEVFAESEGVDPALVQSLKVEQERMREQMDIIKREMQVIMQEITSSMKQDNDRLRAELENLRAKTDQLRQEIASILRKEQVSAKAEMSGLRSEMEKSQLEADRLKETLAVALEVGKQDWKKSAEIMKEVLASSRQVAVADKVNSAEVLNETRLTGKISQEEQKLVLDNSRSEALSSMNSAIKNQGGAKEAERNEKVKKETTAALDDARLKMKENLALYKKEAEVRKQKEVTAFNIDEKKNEVRRKSVQEEGGKRVETSPRKAAETQTVIKKKGAAAPESEDKAVAAQRHRPSAEKPLEEKFAKADLAPVERKKVAGSEEKTAAEQQKKDYGKTALEKTDRRLAGDEKGKSEATAALSKDFGKDVLAKGVDAAKPGQGLAGRDEPGKEEADRKNKAREVQRRDESKVERKVVAQEQAEEDVPPEEEDLGVFQGEIGVDPLGEHKKKLGDLSDRIKALKDQLRKNKVSVRPTLVSIGKLYLESQRYLNGMSLGDRMKILLFADRSGMILGNYEMTLWALKSALHLKVSDAELNRLIGEVYAESHNEAAARYYAKRAEQLAASGKSKGKKVEVGKAQTAVEDVGKKFPGETSPVAVVAKAAR